MKLPPTTLLTVRKTRIEPTENCGARVASHRWTETQMVVSEPLNRGLPVTDKSRVAWQNRATRMKTGSSRSVCRELPRMALAARSGHMYRLRLNHRVQAYRLEIEPAQAVMNDS
jgi:hypothetical protein